MKQILDYLKIKKLGSPVLPPFEKFEGLMAAKVLRRNSESFVVAKWNDDFLTPDVAFDPNANFGMVDEFLEKKGLKKQDMVTVKEIDLTDVDYNLKSISINWGFSKEWYDFYTAENNLNTEEKDILKKLLEKNDKNNVYVYKSINNEIIAVAMGSVEKNRMGIFNVYVKDTYRKKGYATEILEGLLVEARKINVEKAYLQVMETNERALKLYKKMGFVPKYKTWYRY